MAFVHAESVETRETIIHHTHGDLLEIHIVKTTVPEPSHCSDSQVNGSVVFESRNFQHIQYDCFFIVSMYHFGTLLKGGTIDDAQYFQYYP